MAHRRALCQFRYVAFIFCLCMPAAHLFSQSFSPTETLNTGRFGSTSTVLPNGQVLVTGGINGTSATSAAELYNPVAHTWIPTGSMTVARSGHTASLLSNGLVLIVGGVSASVATALDSAEIYNPATGTFALTGAPTVGRIGHSATAMRNGSVLIAGGVPYSGPGALNAPSLTAAVASAEIYNPSSGAFTATRLMNEPRAYHSATALGDGTVLLVGGMVATKWYGSTPPAEKSAEVFNPSTGTFTLVGNMVEARMAPQAALLSDATVLIAGGVSNTSDATAEIYNPTTQSFGLTGNMTVPRYVPTLVGLNDGTILVAGGESGASTGTCLSSAEIYNVSYRTFSTTGALSSARCGADAVLLGDGTAFIVGGASSLSSIPPTPLKSADIYTYPTTSGSIDPKFIVLAVTYAPPGAKSTVSYGTSTLLGTSSSLQDSFTNVTSVSDSVGTGVGVSLFGIGGSTSITGTASSQYTQESDTTTTISINKTVSNGLTVYGPASSGLGLDHDYDVIWVWLNPKVNLTAGSSSGVLLWNGYSFDNRDPYDEMDVIGLYVYCLKNPTSSNQNCTANQSRLARTWDTSGLGGLTAVDYNSILARDPFVQNPYYNPNSDSSGRYDLQNTPTINYVPAPAGGQPYNQTFGTNYQATTSLGQTASDSYQVGFSIDIKTSAGLILDLQNDLKSSNTTTWENKWSTTQTQTTGQTAMLSITGPLSTDGYTGPTGFQVWKDNVYGTFMFYAPGGPVVNQPLDGAMYSLTNQQAGLCLDNTNWSAQPGTPAQLWTCTGLAVQNWIARSQPGGYFSLINQATGLCLDDTNFSTTPGTRTQLWTCLNNGAQSWLFNDAGNGYYTLQPKPSSAVRLDDPGGSATPGTQLQIWTTNNLTPQNWSIHH